MLRLKHAALIGERQAAPAQACQGSVAASWYRPPSHCRCWARLSQPCLKRSPLLSAAALALGHPGARLHPSAPGKEAAASGLQPPVGTVLPHLRPLDRVGTDGPNL